MLELDLLIGDYADKHLPKMSDSQLKQVESLLNEENPDLWKWLTAQAEAPQHLQGNQIFQVHLRSLPLTTSAASAIAPCQHSCATQQNVNHWFQQTQCGKRTNIMAAPFQNFHASICCMSPLAISTFRAAAQAKPAKLANCHPSAVRCNAGHTAICFA